MKSRFHGILRLTRYQEFICFVVVTTLLGAAAGKGRLSWQLLGVLVANWLAVGFAFMINDVEDAPDDALTPEKARRNPVSSGDLSTRDARVASFSVVACSAAVYTLLGFWPLVFGLSCLLLGQLYSWRRVRLKTMPFLDLISHALMLAGLQFLTALFTFRPAFRGPWIFPFLAVVAISMYGELFNELRDWEGDRKAGLTHTANLLGPARSQGLMIGFVAVGAGAALATIFVNRLIPTWVLLSILSLAGVIMAPRLLRARHSRTAIELQEPLQKPVEIAAAVSLAAWFVWPWVAPWLGSILGR